MSTYESLARSYDRLTNDVDYDAMLDFLESIMEHENVEPRSVLDLACGTGTLSMRLTARNYAVIGVDFSQDMLSVAYEKAMETGENRPFFVCQEMQKLKLAEPVDCAVCTLDSLNYLTQPRDCEAAIRRVYKALNKGGIFIFDVNSVCKLRSLDDQVFLDEDDDVYCVWRASFDEKANTLDYGMDLFRREGDVWVRSQEEHREYAYSIGQLTGYLHKAGFSRIKVYGDQRLDAPSADEQRIYFSAVKE
jgi:ubiquinone/menaquinone biosynthesis C-methylase UbiE